MPKISVIVPIYNVEKYLPRCIDSILSQTFTDFELILVDDGSPDNCGEICNEFASRDRRIRVIHKENGGVSSARNSGLKVAVGEWISFVDSDDWLHPQFLEILLKLADKYSVSVAAVDLLKTDKKVASEPVDFESVSARTESGKQMLENWSNRFYSTGKLFARSVLLGHWFDEQISYGEDAVFMLQVLGCFNGSIAIADIKLYYYFMRSDSLSGANKSQKRVSLCRAYLTYAARQMDESMKKQYLFAALKRALSTRYGSGVEKTETGLDRACNNILKTALQEMRKLQNVSRREYLKYKVLYLFPFLYRLWRIKDDPSMLKWERSMRNKA